MNKKIQQRGLLLVIGLIFNLTVLVTLASSKTAAELDPTVAQKDSIKNLHRLDFRIEGKSCAACLLSIQRKLNSLPGVKEAVVMLKRPFGVSVIYQEDQIKQEEILAVVKDKEPNIKMLEINDISISKLPSPIIPPFVPMQEAN